MPQQTLLQTTSQNDSSVFEVSIKDWIKTDLHFEHFCLLYAIHTKQSCVKMLFNNLFKPSEEQEAAGIDPAVPVLKSLEAEEWIKIIGNNFPEDIAIRQRFVSLLDTTSASSYLNCESWIEDWRQLFPETSVTKNYSYPPRGDKQACIKKMNIFLKKHGKEFGKENIKNYVFEATKLYISSKRRENWAYLQQAHYFIEKSSISTLYQQITEYANNLLNKNKNGNTTNSQSSPLPGEEAY